MTTVKAIVFVRHYRDYQPGMCVTGSDMDKLLLTPVPKDAYHKIDLPVTEGQTGAPLNGGEK